MPMTAKAAKIQTTERSWAGKGNEPLFRPAGTPPDGMNGGDGGGVASDGDGSR